MDTERTGYLRRLLLALVGKEPPSPAQPGDEAGLRGKVAELELELRERDQRIEAMKAEYATLETAKQRAAATAGEGELEKLFKKLAAPLSNVAALAGLAEEGREVAVSDLLDLFRGFEKDLARFGLERVGAVSEEAPFDIAVHQRMSGGSVRPGSVVTIRVPGYRFGEKVLLKALVTTRNGE
ncbi:MAG: nucleotide exchange factor GrpE [Armatimonadetes bacterium CG_4_9_14_3_um_filter_66_14]|nr:MAG: nucleotide exchange factor GrpE [Armatimonadetes bacterium CG_4_9_14_3_um_filter_66_14]